MFDAGVDLQGVYGQNRVWYARIDPLDVMGR